MKRQIMRMVERLAYWLGVDAVFYWFNRGAKRVVAFHNVLPDELMRPEDDGGVCFSASEFRLAIRELKKHFAFSVDQNEEIAKPCLHCGRDVSSRQNKDDSLFLRRDEDVASTVLQQPRNDCSELTLTFDDGYLNQYETAARILQEEGNIPAMLFVSGSLIGSKGYENCLVIDKILQWQKVVPLEIAEKLFGRSFGGRMELWSEALLPAFAADAEQKGRGLLARLEAVYSVGRSMADRDSEFVRLRFDGVTAEQIADLRRRGWKVGYHTYSHYPVSRLSDEEARKELTPTDPAMLKVPFAYPYGNEDFVSARDERIVESLGYPCAYSCGAEMTGRYGGRFFLRRMMPPIDKYRLHFELSGLRHFLKYRKLLPQV